MTGILLSEWTKLRSLRSTALTLLALAVLAVGLAALISSGAGAGYPELGPAERDAFDPAQISTQSYLAAQLAIGVLGVLVVTGEYATGMIRTSLTAVPRRARLLAAKAAVFAAVALVAGLVVGFGAFLVGQATLAAAGAPHTTLGDPHAARAAAGAGLFLATIGLLGVAVGTLVRSTAGGITVLVATTLLVPAFGQGLPGGWGEALVKWWPATAGSRLMTVKSDPDLLAPWAGYGVLGAAVAATLVAAFVVLRARDA
ncbi:ABC transporter permease [Phytohabitans sp. ZYX-F-186]|uniref:ABC transporter permease n=1 Tax=Phytohabitans maris TaxID=3071409 RepID=A0ABU0ZNF8_9ACTN|nr:ABC transporter permease [Phytohabitans sp. ZYX-F-186]MDQ7908196.1 ABC transporter permease [Phytohabitans sp. ZYX-F-186]